MYADLKAQGRNCNFEDKSYRSSSESGANDGCYVNFADGKTETFLPVPGENTKRLCLHLSRKENNLSFSGFRSDIKKTYAQLSEHVLYISRPFLICCFDMKPPVGREIPQEGLIMKIKESPDIR